jgi:hypothetical protein
MNKSTTSASGFGSDSANGGIVSVEKSDSQDWPEGSGSGNWGGAMKGLRAGIAGRPEAAGGKREAASVRRDVRGVG